MAAWIRCSRGRLVYSGRITRAPLTAWTKTQEGHAVVVKAASRIRFSLFGKTRAAARRLWRHLADAVSDAAVAAAIELEVQSYLPRLGEMAFAEGLPRGGVDLRRLAVVPNVLLNGAAYSAIAKRLNEQPAFAALEAGDALKEFFITTLIGEMETAVANARPSPNGPLTADTDWVSVGLNTSYVWRVPVFQAPPWNGHHYLLEVTREPITRALRKAVAAKIDTFEASLKGLSRADRNDILRRAQPAA